MGFVVRYMAYRLLVKVSCVCEVLFKASANSTQGFDLYAFARNED